MEYHSIQAEDFSNFRLQLTREERAEGTIAQYLRDAAAFVRWTHGQLDEQSATRYKAYLLQKGYAPVTINAKIAGVNRFLQFLGKRDWKTRALRLQKSAFRDERRELTQAEFQRLVKQAEKRSRRLALLMETICATGIRVSELRYITVETVRQAKAAIRMKGKVRTIVIPQRLCRKLLRYAREKKIASGEIFLTRSGKSISRRQIWAEMKQLAAAANVEPTKIFPHNLRHLFASVYYPAYHDIASLADVLGHASIETTRIYLAVSSAVHAQRLEAMHMVT